MQLKSGDILLTVNDERFYPNETPGNWNHCAVVLDKDWVIEAQEEIPHLKDILPDGGVVKSNGWFFFERYPEILCLRFGQIDISKAAALYIGNPYRKISSFFIFMRKPTRGENCVSLLRRAYMDTTGEDPKWKIPDDIARDPKLMQIGWKREYENWKEPEDWYKGITV